MRVESTTLPKRSGERVDLRLPGLQKTDRKDFAAIYNSSYRIRLSKELNPAATPPSSLSLPLVRNR